MPERPWLKLYVQDLLGNQDLARCSIGAFGLWVKILCHAYPHGGYLTFDDATPADGSDDGVEETARLLGLNPGEFRALRDELFAKKVARRDKRGVLYSGRMVRDAAKSAVRADAWQSNTAATVAAACFSR